MIENEQPNATIPDRYRGGKWAELPSLKNARDALARSTTPRNHSVGTPSAASVILAAAALARRLLGPDPVPIATPSTARGQWSVGQPTTHPDYFLTFTSRGPHDRMVWTTRLVQPVQGRGLLVALQIYEVGN